MFFTPDFWHKENIKLYFSLQADREFNSIYTFDRKQGTVNVLKWKNLI